MDDDRTKRVGFFRGLWAVGRGVFRTVGKVFRILGRIGAFVTRRSRRDDTDAPNAPDPSATADTQDPPEAN